MRAERIEVRQSRERILAAAEVYFSTHDVDPSMAELAQLAGVGNATLYRRFASIDELVPELYGRVMAHLQDVAAVVAVQTTGWDGIVALMTGIVETLQQHPAIPRLNRRMVAVDSDHRFASQWQEQLDNLVHFAQAEGSLRPDVNANDVTFAAFRIGSYSNLPPSERDRVLWRQLGIVLDGLRANGGQDPLPGTPITPEELHDIFRHEVANPLPPIDPRG